MHVSQSDGHQSRPVIQLPRNFDLKWSKRACINKLPRNFDLRRSKRALEKRRLMSNHIIVRNRRFDTTPAGAQQSTQADPIALALYASLSATFPLGEAFFVRSVAHYGRDLPAALKTEVDAFVKQEAHHSREHAHFNSSIDATGLPIKSITAKAAAQLAALEVRAPINQLATTVALEHFT
jgi:predicted metal-dependent hydrolase